MATVFILPTSIVDPDGVFTNKDDAGDGDTGTPAQQNDGYGNWLEAYYAGGVECDKVRLWLFSRGGPVEIQVQYGGGWHAIFNGVPAQSQFQEFDIIPIRILTGIRAKILDAYPPYWRVYEMQFGQREPRGFLAGV